ncbi:MIT C-terminal domain-containing protein [Campylobacter sp. 19-13652]|uniref:MIT C-terminal domain-containing protein n=1 Tax=Campylobacter sp. 19-13652 TaxID=2840180 RepID=UPI001C85A45A|nr:MIT C-terminal domain-containing protein [Campylobacter sp. 19-13652]
MMLEDNLLECYLKFKNGECDDVDTINRILHYIKTPILFTKSQLSKVDTALQKSILSSLGNYRIKDNIEEAAKDTVFKVILSDTKDYFPYVNIKNDIIENNFTATFKQNMNRNKAKLHLKSLFESCNEILIRDPYLLYNNVFDSMLNFAQEIFNDKELKVYFSFNKRNKQKSFRELKEEFNKINQNWEIKEDKNNTYSASHDRYILIDRKIEIILTSGIEHLYDLEKDFTYIIRLLLKSN